jgi:fructosamine-3-kinase
MSDKINKYLIEKIFPRMDPSLKTIELRPFGSEGLYNKLFLIETKNKENNYSSKRFVLRIAPPDNVPKLFYEKNMMHSEPLLHKSVLENTKVPVPKIYYHDFSRELIDRDYLIMEYLPGKNSNFSHRELGKYVRQIHDIKGKFFGYPERNLKRMENWRKTFIYYSRLIFDDCLNAGSITKEEYSFFNKIYDENKATIEDKEPSLLHLDLWSSNILSQKGKITGILDFDRGMFGDVELEFAVLDTYGYNTPEFFEGYGIKRPKSNETLIRRDLYHVYEIIKYAFIRMARGKSRIIARNYVERSKYILENIYKR